MSYNATSGLLVWIKGDKEDQWYTALNWQYKHFVEEILISRFKESSKYVISLDKLK